MVTQNSANNKTEATGKLMQGQGVGTASDYSTATYPATATGTGTILRADGTNWVATTATYPTSTTINQVLYSSAANVVSGLATANNGVLIANNTGVPSMLAAGTINQVLTANTAAPPSWQDSRGYTLYMSTSSGNPADSTTYYWAQGIGFILNTVTTIANSQLQIPVTGTITKAYGVITVGGTLGSASNSTVRIRLNNTTNTDVSTTVTTNAASNTFSNTALSIAVTAGDYINIQFVGPAWATNPTTVRGSITVYVA